MSLLDTRTAALPTPNNRRPGAAVGLAVVSGSAVAVQSRINGELGVRLHDGIAAAVISFGVGLVALTALVFGSSAGRRQVGVFRTALQDGSLRPWQCLGGTCGAFMVANQGLTVGRLGVAVFTVALVAGQSASSLVVDRAGFGPAGRQPVTAARLAGAALTVPAVFLAVGDRPSDPAGLALALLPALAGVGLAWQQAVNGRVRVATDSVLTATFVNFAVGAATLLATFAIDLVVRGWPSGQLPTEPWLYLGGPIGILFIAIAAALVRFTGVLLLGLATIAGQVAGAMLIDLAAPGNTTRPGPFTLLGAVLTLVAVVVAGRRRT
jgi:transporter family-2 protein